MIGTHSYGPNFRDYKFFKKEELKCKCGKCGSDGSELKITLMEPLVTLREKLGFPLVVTSGYRCKWWNRVNKGAINSAHLTGEAIDIYIYYAKALQFVAEALKLKAFTGFGIKQTGKLCRRCVHLDIKEREEPTIWSY